MIEEMLDKWRRGSRGPLPHLTPLQLLNSLLLIEHEGPLGRRALAQALHINDGIARGLLERLAEQGVVTVEDTGATLTPQGKSRLQQVLWSISVKKILALDSTDLVPGRLAVGIHISRRYQNGMTGIPQRDEAVKAGADGSITMTVKDGKLVVPPDNKDTAILFPKEYSRLRNLFKPSEGDLIIIGFAEDKSRAMSGALAAVLSLFPKV